ncbi:peptidase [Kineococcus sp. TBRC 1896]|uniref:Peptidase n=1 Tax=Kineococcus mangrovi TaxID=1660183 RepID=A0ABV4HYK9_9ACTN
MRRSVLTAAVVTSLAAAVVGVSASAATAAPTIPSQRVVHFAKGKDAATLTGHLTDHGDVRYAFDARAGQSANLRFAAAAQGSGWTLIGPTGPVVHEAADAQQKNWTYELPETGRYYVDVVSPTATDYSLRLTIPRTAQRAITFVKGQRSATVAGIVKPRHDDRYTFKATKGQKADIQLTGEAKTVAFTLVAPDGTPLHTTRTEQQRDVTITLPRSGTYVLTVSSAERTGYELALTI